MNKTKHYPIYMSALPTPKKQHQLMTVKNLTSKSADLYIYGEIVDNTDWKWDESDVMPEDVLNALNQVNELDELNIYVNSPGGSVFAGLAIYNMLSRNKAKKKVYIDGVAASIASVIALAGDEVYMPSNAFLMIHNPWTLAIGNARDLRKVADDLDQIAKGALAVYKDNLVEGVEEATIQTMLDNETWLNAEEAAKYFRLNIVESKNYAASAKDYLKHYAKTPKPLLEEPEPTVTPFNKIKFQNELDLLTL
ncbi:head maturation protease, ClpP-related [Alkalihalophilus marmarensis]|uniref:ATP-dependent Clp protease proteolytic subunit n=1 Tax=Alkalihalophilus marmarensis DSM 21297 TaxID=1188261 RepID=U6SN30_9BACI|nr:tail fiber protein [Alkalihalophilus marmarensis DSM 21297]